jgi:putative tryptophan/tyrosine transport system substrate-binding protein
MKCTLLASRLAIGFGLLLLPLDVTGQQAGKVPQVAIVGFTPPSTITGSEPSDPHWRAFIQGLRALGYVEGQNVRIERLTMEGHFDRVPEITSELVRRQVDVIVTWTDTAALAMKQVTSTIPIVMAQSWDPVGSGLAASLARPGGNVTGLAIAAQADIDAKRLQLLKETVPRASRVAVLHRPRPGRPFSTDFKEAEEAARTLGVTLVPMLVDNTDQLPEAFAGIRQRGVDALYVPEAGMTYLNRRLIAELATKHRLPAIYGLIESMEFGALMAYGPPGPEMSRRAATYVDKILKGGNPGVLPIEQAIEFKLILNRRRARDLGLTFPPPVLGLANEIIE